MEQAINKIFVKGFKQFVNSLKMFYETLPKELNIEFYLNFCKKTQVEKVYWHLMNFGNITNLQCHTIYGIRHAPKIIQECKKVLSKEGYHIKNVHKKGCDRFGNPTNFDVYTLVKDDEH